MKKTCAVVGAGAAGLSAARRLQTQGVEVTLFDKGRRPGGRLASRDTAHGVFDHGVWHLAVPGAALCHLLDLCPEGRLADGPARNGDAVAPAAARSWVGVPSNNQIAVDWSSGTL
jgi:renalase